MSAIERIKLLLKTEEQKIERLSREVTSDPPLTVARIKCDAFRQCLHIVESTMGELPPEDHVV